MLRDGHSVGDHVARDDEPAPFEEETRPASFHLVSSFFASSLSI
jgi:hypothetical protein